MLILAQLVRTSLKSKLALGNVVFRGESGPFPLKSKGLSNWEMGDPRLPLAALPPCPPSVSEKSKWAPRTFPSAASNRKSIVCRCRRIWRIPSRYTWSLLKQPANKEEPANTVGVTQTPAFSSQPPPNLLGTTDIPPRRPVPAASARSLTGRFFLPPCF